MPRRTWSLTNITRNLSGKLPLHFPYKQEQAAAAGREEAKAIDLLSGNLEDCLERSAIWQLPPDGTGKMGKKSNAFDYTNRSSTGVKLGDIIAKDVIKEAANVQKVAQRRTRKVSIGSTDCSNGVQNLDIKAPGKDLGDDGVSSLAAGLETAYNAATSAASVALEDLNLQDNNLSTAALARLAPVIHLARLELKTLVLSGNRIKVINEKEAAEWETFLLAFADCKRLRRLDLSGNVELGARAFEIFTRIHTNEPAVTPVALGGDRETLTLPEGREHEDDTASVKGRASGDFGSEIDPMAAAGFISRRCGLRSIPYIDFQNTGLDDCCALWLSYTLEDHYHPNRLISDLNAPPATTTIEIYQQDTAEGGILWKSDENEASLGRDGLRLLNRTEIVRKQASLGDDASILTQDSDFPIVRASSTRVSSRGSGVNRRTSVRLLQPQDDGERDMSELDSARRHLQRAVIDKKIQRQILNKHTPGKAAEYELLPTTELWKTGEVMMDTSRKLLILAPMAGKRKCYTGPCLIPRSSAIESKADTKIERQDSITEDMHDSRPGSPKNTSAPVPTLTRTVGKSYAATLSSQHRADQHSSAITEVTNGTVAPKMTLKPCRRNTSSGSSAELQFITRKLAALPPTSSQERYLEYQDRYNAQHIFRDPSTACQLPVHIFARIARSAGAGSEAEVPTHILSAEQQAACYRWGQSREMLARARDWMRKDESAQRWMLLDGVRCLAYGT